MMAITTYTELKTAIADWLHRPDWNSSTSQIIDFVTLAEVELNSELRNRLMETDNTLSLTSGTRTITLPTGYIEPIKLDLVVSGEDNDTLTYVQPQQLAINADSGAASRPRYWTVNGANIEFANLSDQTYTVSFRMLKEYDLASTSTNTLLSKYPSMYLYASLIQAARWTKDTQLEQTMTSAYERLKQKIKQKEGRSKSLANLRIEMPAMRKYNHILTG